MDSGIPSSPLSTWEAGMTLGFIVARGRYVYCFVWVVLHFHYEDYFSRTRHSGFYMTKYESCKIPESMGTSMIGKNQPADRLGPGNGKPE